MDAQHIHHGKLVLVVDHDADMRSLLFDCLCEIGLQVATAVDGNDALQKIQHVEPHVVLTDLRMPAGGFDYVKQLRAYLPSCPIILLTAFGTHEAKAEAMACGVNAFLEKPIKVGDLHRAVLAVLEGQWEPSDER
jgi:CheY-like chemotaxis protein